MSEYRDEVDLHGVSAKPVSLILGSKMIVIRVRSS